ncbi:MAG: glycosyltransferase family 4 protein [Candidatus Levybacteria bacterium]|nr:glycosyltransferase family 4 protein [Candidatus Levybacteria bacterium]
MKILLVSSYLPYPLTNGGNIRLYNLLKFLQKTHEITLVCEIRQGQNKDDVHEVEKVCHKVYTVKRRKQWSVKNILKTAVSANSFLTTGHKLEEMSLIVSMLLSKESFDAIHVETFYVLQNVPKTTLPIILVEHNVEYLVYERFKEKASLFLKPLLTIDIEKIKRAEKQAWSRVSIVVAVSEKEKEIIGEKCKFVVPNGVDLKTFVKKKIVNSVDVKKKKILYIGDYTWIQNTDAVLYIIKFIWPLIKKNLNVSLWIVGKNMPATFKKIGDNDASIIFDDDNKETAVKIFSEADVLLAPKRVGGGTSYKIIEAMAVGTPVVTNSFGLEGLDFEKDKEIIVENKPEELAEEVIRVLTQKDYYRRISDQGRKAVEKKYDWIAIADKLDGVYQSVKNINNL